MRSFLTDADFASVLDIIEYYVVRIAYSNILTKGQGIICIIY